MISIEYLSFWFAILVLGVAGCATGVAVHDSVVTADLNGGSEYAAELDSAKDLPSPPRGSEGVSTPDSIRLLLLPDEAWAAKTVCEVSIALKRPSFVRWRLLPVAVYRDIRDGRASDLLHAYVDERGIVDCGAAGCWSESRMDVRGCVVACESRQLCVSLRPE